MEAVKEPETKMSIEDLEMYRNDAHRDYAVKKATFDKAKAELEAAGSAVNEIMQELDAEYANADADAEKSIIVTS